MNVLFLSRLKIRTKGREGEISVDHGTHRSVLLFPRSQLKVQALQLGAGSFRSLAVLCAALRGSGRLVSAHSGLSGREGCQCISDTQCVSPPQNVLSGLLFLYFLPFLTNYLLFLTN